MSDQIYEISYLSADAVDAAAPLLAASAFKPLRYLAKEVGAELAGFWSRSIADSLHASGSEGVIAARGGAPLGLLIYSVNPWETSLLGKKAVVINAFVVDGAIPDRKQVARSLLDAALVRAHATGVQFMVGKTYTDDLATIHALESRGFLLMDTIVDCYYDYRRVPFESLPRPALAGDVTLRLAAPADRDELVAVARLTFQDHFGRFHADERIGKDTATRAYERWIHSSMDGYADWIHVAVVGGKIVGFSIWKRASKAESTPTVRVGHYSIGGIHPGHHGQGLFTALTYAGMQSFRDIADIVEGPTHVNNYGVQLGYAKMGWRVLTDARHSFHKWLEST